MAEVQIKSGNSGEVAEVDSNKRLHTAAVIETESNHACDSGVEEKYNINTGTITLTNATKTSILYIKNEGNDDLVITALIYNLGNSTGGTGDGTVDVLRNPTAGDIITNANDVAVGPAASANQNFGASNILSGKFYKGATGETALSGGSLTVSSLLASPAGRIVITLGSVVLPKGSSLGIDYTPQTSNTSQAVQVAAACFVKTAKVAV
jgi:hypothetical protein